MLPKLVSKKEYAELGAQPILVSVAINPLSGRLLNVTNTPITNRQAVARVFRILADQLSKTAEERDVDTT